MKKRSLLLDKEVLSGNDWTPGGRVMNLTGNLVCFTIQTVLATIQISIEVCGDITNGCDTGGGGNTGTCACTGSCGACGTNQAGGPYC